MSSPTKPLKPPRIRKTMSVPYETPPQDSSQNASQRQAAKINLISALKMAGARERSNLSISESPSSKQDNDSVNQASSKRIAKSHSSFDTVLESDKNGSVMGVVIDSNESNKAPMLPPTTSNIPAKPKPPVSFCSTPSPSQVAVNPAESSSQSSDDDAFMTTPPQSTTAGSVDDLKKPMLPPNKPRAISYPISGSPSTKHVTPSPPQKGSEFTGDRNSSSSPQKKPLPKLRTMSHDDIAPEYVDNKISVVKGDCSQTNAFEEDAGVVGSTPNTFETNMIPISPSSTSSGIPEDSVVLENNPSPSFSDSRGTTPSCITTNERSSSISAAPADTTSNTTNSPSPLGDLKEEDDNDTDSPKKQQKPLKKPVKPVRVGNQRTVVRKDDTSWIKKKSESSTPPSSPSNHQQPPPPSTQGTTTTASANSTPSLTFTSSPAAHSQQPKKSYKPYRSIAILPDKPSSSVDLLQDTSKPMIGPSGKYYPPAVKLKPPEGLSTDLSLRKTQSNERIFSIDKEDKGTTDVTTENIPSRYKKTRRSSSFSGSKSNKLRPTSMMENESPKEKNKFSLSTTINRASTESAKDDMLKQGQKDKKSKSGSKVKDFFFRKKNSQASVIDEASSSEDDEGGTIARMPKKFERKPPPWETQVSEPGDDYIPEYDKLFEYVFVLGLKEVSERGVTKLTTETLYKYPPASREFAKDDALRSIDQFCFPDIEQWQPVLSYRSENYSFVLTSLDGSRRFGYCRRLLPNGTEARLPEVYCIISPLGCFDLYSNLLDHIEQRRSISKAAVYSFLSSVVANPFPGPGRSVSIRVLPAGGREMEVIELKRAHDSRLEHVDFAELYNTLGPKMLIQVFSSLLMERRVILAAQRLSKLSSCCHALLALLYPFEWQHTFIPVLPNSLIDFCGSPLPFIIGISPTMAKKLDKLDIEMEEALVVDLDKNKFIKKFGDESSILPNKLFQYLMSKLGAAVVTNEYSKPPEHRSGQAKADKTIVTAFMTVFAYLFGQMREFLQVTDTTTGELKLQKSEFIKSFQHSKSTRRFLEAFLITQMFDQFIEERENPIKSANIAQGLYEKQLPELIQKAPEVELFSNKKKFWKKRKPPTITNS